MMHVATKYNFASELAGDVLRVGCVWLDSELIQTLAIAS